MASDGQVVLIVTGLLVVGAALIIALDYWLRTALGWSLFRKADHHGTNDQWDYGYKAPEEDHLWTELFKLPRDEGRTDSDRSEQGRGGVPK